MAEVLAVLTTSPAGLGHIRVMQALKQGAPASLPLTQVGLVDRRMQSLHRATSINPHLRQLMEWVQTNPVAEGGFTRWYRQILRNHPEASVHLLEDVIKRHRPMPDTVIVLCTHFGLAHQIAAVKAKLADDLQIKVKLVVVVTDDSPQLLWAVKGADLILVPSPSTRTELIRTLELLEPPVPEVRVVPYPVSLRLGKILPANQYRDRRQQVKAQSRVPLQIIIPISGAAVQLAYFQELITGLQTRLPFQATLVARDSQATHAFLDWCQLHPSIRVRASNFDQEVVEMYEAAYEEQVMAVEVTKPSEQAFKALLTPKHRGGSLLLFTDPVGRQEDDNLAFLRRHKLIPSLEDQADLDMVMTGQAQVSHDLITEARFWRGVLLPLSGYEAAGAIEQLKASGILAAMANFGGMMPGHPELSSEGVKRVWQEVLTLP